MKLSVGIRHKDEVHKICTSLHEIKALISLNCCEQIGDKNIPLAKYWYIYIIKTLPGSYYLKI